MNFRNPEELSSKAQKIISFNEFTSNKVIGLKKLLSSRSGLICIILIIGLIASTFALELLTIILTNGLTLQNIYNGVFSSLLDVGLPIYFVVLCFLIRKATKYNEKDVEPFDSLNPQIKSKNGGLLSKLFKFKRIITIYFIILGVFSILNSISSINVELVSDVYAEMLGRELTSQDIYEYQMLGYNYLTNGIFYLMVGYAFHRASKLFFNEVIFEEDNKYIDFIILSVFLFIFAGIYLVGGVLGTIGIMNPMYKISIAKSVNQSFGILDVFGLIQFIFLISSLIFVGYLTLKVRMIMIKNVGQTLYQQEKKPVYTVSIDDLED